MKLNKLVDTRSMQVYSISDASKEFKKMYPLNYIVLTIDDSGMTVDNTNELNVEELLFYDACSYIFTYKSTLSKKITESILECDKLIRYTNDTNSTACLDRYYIGANNKINVIMSVYPRYNMVSPMFNNNIVIKASSKKLKLDSLGKQVCSIINQTLAEKNKQSSKMTVEDWLKEFIIHPFVTPLRTCCIYPKVIDDKVLHKQYKCKISDLIVLYDARAKNYNEEFKLFTAIAEAFDSKDPTVTVYDSYNCCLNKIIKELEKHNMKYTMLNDYSLETKYKNLKQLNITYQLTDFI